MQINSRELSHIMVTAITTLMRLRTRRRMNHFTITPFIATFYGVFHQTVRVHPTLPPKLLLSCSLGRCQRANACEHVFMCASMCVLLKEVASHESQLMSITLFRSSIHPTAQGPIHPLLFTLVDPKSPRARSHTHTHLQRWTVTYSRNPTQMPEWAPTEPWSPTFYPHQHISIASTSKYSFRMSDTQQEEVSYSFLLSPSACESFWHACATAHHSTPGLQQYAWHDGKKMSIALETERGDWMGRKSKDILYRWQWLDPVKPEYWQQYWWINQLSS